MQRVRNAYSPLRCTYATSYCNCLSFVQEDAQLRGEYVRGYHSRYLENGYSLHVGKTTSKVDQTFCLFSHDDGNDDIIEFAVSPSSFPSSASYRFVFYYTFLFVSVF